MNQKLKNKEVTIQQLHNLEEKREEMLVLSLDGVFLSSIATRRCGKQSLTQSAVHVERILRLSKIILFAIIVSNADIAKTLQNTIYAY